MRCAILVMLLFATALGGCKQTITGADVSLYMDGAAPVVLGGETLQIEEGIAAAVNVVATVSGGTAYNEPFSVTVDDPGVLGLHDVQPGSHDTCVSVDTLYMIYGESQGATTMRVKPCSSSDDGEVDIAVTVTPNTT
jgi:hypothetical protein